MESLEIFDARAALDDPKVLKEALTQAWAENDGAGVMNILAALAERRGMAAVARQAGINRTAAYKSLSKDGNPRLDTLLGVMGALGIKPKFTFA